MCNKNKRLPKNLEKRWTIVIKKKIPNDINIINFLFNLHIEPLFIYTIFYKISLYLLKSVLV